MKNYNGSATIAPENAIPVPDRKQKNKQNERNETRTL